MTAPPRLTERFLAAVALASELHGGERRSGTEIPYLAHLLVVTGLVVEDGGDEDQAVAAMLHDAVEDGGGRELLARIAAQFGTRVADIVAACSDSLDAGAAEPWIVRKRSYLAHLQGVTDDGVLRVALADKVNNARALVRDYREEGQLLWVRFDGRTPRDQLWYYGSLLDFFERRRPGPLTEDLERAVDELAWLVVRDPVRPARRAGLRARVRWRLAQVALELYARLRDRGTAARTAPGRTLSSGDPAPDPSGAPGGAAAGSARSRPARGRVPRRPPQTGARRPAADDRSSRDS